MAEPLLARKDFASRAAYRRYLEATISDRIALQILQSCRAPNAAAVCEGRSQRVAVLMSEPRRIDSPRISFWMTRMVRGGIEVPACIAFEPDANGNPVLVARLRGDVVDTDEIWLRRGREITKDEYEYQLALAAWADDHEPDSPRANPTKPINLNSMRSIY